MEKELKFFETQVCCADGTFFIVKNLPFSQLYMITAQFRHFDNVLTVPFIFILMKEKKACNYEEIFDDPVHLCNFAAKFANYDETAFIFEPQLQLTIL